MAQQNIQRYNENVLITNSNLTKDWLDRLGVVRSGREAFMKVLAMPAKLPSRISEFDSVIKKRAEITNSITNDARYTAAQVSERIKSDISRRIRVGIGDLELWKLDIEAPLSASEANISLSQTRIEPNSLLPLLAASLILYWASIREAEATALREAAAELRKKIEDTNDLLEQRSPVTKYEDTVRAAQKSLADDLAQFFRNVELYRNNVFSHATKESIAALGIGAQLDALESEFTDADKETFTTDTMQRLFSGFAELSAKALTLIPDLDKLLRPLSATIRDLKVPSPSLAAQILAPELDAEKDTLLRSINAELQDNVGHLLSNLEVELSAAVVAARRKYNAEWLVARRRRRFRYATLIGGFWLIGFVGYFAYVHFNREVPPDLFNTILWHVVGDSIFGLVGYAVARWFDNFPKRARRIRDEYEILLRGELSRTVENALRTHPYTAIEESKLFQRLRTAYQALVDRDPDEWRQVAAARLGQLREIEIR